MLTRKLRKFLVVVENRMTVQRFDTVSDSTSLRRIVDRLVKRFGEQPVTRIYVKR